MIRHERHGRVAVLTLDRPQRLNPRGESLEGTRKLAPHLVLDAPPDARSCGRKLFGPILPVVCA